IQGSASNQGFFMSQLYMTGTFARGYSYEVNATAEGNALRGGYASGSIEVSFANPGAPSSGTSNSARNNATVTTNLYAHDSRPVPAPPEPTNRGSGDTYNFYTTNYYRPALVVVPVVPVYNWVLVHY